MRRAAKVDANQTEIVKAFRDLGCDVIHTHQLGNGAPDIFVAYGGLWLACEIKGAKGKLTKAQKTLYDGLKTLPRIVRTPAEAAAAVDTLKRWSAAIRKGI